MSSSVHSIEPGELMAYLDGELSVDRAALVASHLEHCDECRTGVAESRSISAQLSEWQAEPAPLRLTERVTAAVAAGELKPREVGVRVPPRIFGLPRWAWATAGFACLVLMAAAISIPNLMRSRIAAPPPPTPIRMGQAIAQPSLPPPAYSNYAPSMAMNARPASSASYQQLAGRAQGVAGGVPGGVPTGEIGGVIGGRLGKLQGGYGGGGNAEPPTTGPLIVRTASLKLLTKEFEKTRAAIEEAVQRHRGYSAQLVAGSESNGARTFSANFRVPADQLDAAVAEIKQLAHVEQESQGGEEVTEQYVDLAARLSNSRRTEQTLLDVLEKRTGRLSDVLAVEQELARVREEIESMEAQLKSLQNRVSFATLRVELREEYKAELEMTPPSIGGRLRNALVEGYRAAVDSVVGLVLFMLNVAPFLLLWALILFFPARYVWRRLRAASEPK